MTAPTIRAQVIGALLSGREVFATELAREIGTYPMLVTRTLKQLGNLVNRERRSGGPGRQFVAYTARDVVALQEELDRELRGGVRLMRFDELIAAWGIAFADIELPARQYRAFSDEVAA